MFDTTLHETCRSREIQNLFNKSTQDAKETISFSYSLNYNTDRYKLIKLMDIVNTDTCNIIGVRHQYELTRETSRGYTDPIHYISISVPTFRGTIREVWVILNIG